MSLIRGIHKIGQDLRAVDAPPPEQVVGYGIVLVPADLCGHERVNPVVHAEFLLEEPLAVHELTYQGLAGGYVTIRLHPHAAVSLPSALTHPLFYFCVNFRAVFFDILI